MSSKSDASTKILGFKYQEMVALKECFEAKDGTKIYLECLGDISEGKTSIEVKHSINDDKKLIDTHIDFWKTLSNIITEYDKFRFYNKFILHTTAEIKMGSILDEWEKLEKSDKKRKILGVKPNEKIKAHYANVKDFDKKELENLLDKFEIKDKQLSAKEYYKNILLEHPAVTNTIAPKDREEFICSVFGYLSFQLVTGKNYTWTIDIDSFKDNFRAYSKKYQIDDLSFPISNATKDSVSKTNFHFVKALEDIGYDRKIGRSMDNYIRASESRIKMIETRTSLCENLDNFDDEIKDFTLELKDSHIDQITEQCDTKEKSKRFFDDSLMKVSSKTKIEGVTNTRSYYPKGRLLHNVEIKAIDINLKSEDESK